MAKKIIKFVTTMVVIFSIVAISTTTFAIDPKTIQEKANTDTGLASSLKNVSGNILGAVQIVGTAVAVIMLIVLAIKYISAAPGDKAEIKKHAVVYVVGAVLLFAASNILGLIQQAASWFA